MKEHQIWSRFIKKISRATSSKSKGVYQDMIDVLIKIEEREAAEEDHREELRPM